MSSVPAETDSVGASQSQSQRMSTQSNAIDASLGRYEVLSSASEAESEVAARSDTHGAPTGSTLLLRMPHELLLNILGFVDVPDLVAVSRVSVLELHYGSPVYTFRCVARCAFDAVVVLVFACNCRQYVILMPCMLRESVDSCRWALTNGIEEPRTEEHACVEV